MSTEATFRAPTIGLRDAVALPPLSAVQVTSGASSESSPSMSPVVAAVMNCSVSSAVRVESTGSNRLRRACTCSRARCATVRTVATDLPTAPAMSS